MELFLHRWYHTQGTNGILQYQGRTVCACIELPWRGNRRYVSCIPEGRYRLVRRRHQRWGVQLAVETVPNREGILFHPANNALSELQGCIAPVTTHTAPGVGPYSRIALERLKDLVYPVLDAGEPVWLNIVESSVLISKKQHEQV